MAAAQEQQSAYIQQSDQPQNPLDQIMQTSMSRRRMIKTLTGIGITAGALSKTSEHVSAEDMSLDNEPLLNAIQPVDIKTQKAFKKERGFEVTLNSVSYAPEIAQARIDLAFAKMFNIMDNNKSGVQSGSWTANLSDGVIPEGGNEKKYTQKLKKGSDEDVAIPFWYYDTDATDNSQSSEGSFDPRTTEVVYVQNPAFFDFASEADGEQIYGFTPRLRKDKGLRLEVYVRPSEHQATDEYTAGQARDFEYTWVTHFAMEIFALSYGNRNVWSDFSENYVQKLYNEAPWTVFPEITAAMTGTTDPEQFWSIRNTHYPSDSMPSYGGARPGPIEGATIPVTPFVLQTKAVT